MKSNQKMIKGGVLFCVLLGLFTTTTTTTLDKTLACSTISECSSQIDGAQQKRKELQSEVDKIKSASTDLQAEIYNFQLQAAAFTTQILTAEEEIKSLVKQQEQYQKSMDEIEGKMRDRLVNNQLYFETNKSLNFIANSSSITEMIERSQAVSAFSEADQEMINQYDLEKKAAQRNKENTEKTKQELEKYRSEKEQAIEKNKTIIAEYEKLEAEIEGKISETLKTETLSQAEIEKIKEASTRVPVTTIPGGSTGFVGYPIKTAIKTANYNDTDDVHSTPHSGVDYAPLGDRTLFSLVDGVVVKNEYMQSGFGWYIVIAFQDSQGWKTLLYGHMEGRSPFGVGSTVTRGQAIGITGSTGWSTGVHLHLELSVAGPGPSFVFQPTGSALKFDAAGYFSLPYKW